MSKTQTLKGEKMYKRAYALAQKAHAGQTRKDKKTPYFEHVKEVASRVSGWDLKTVAILHDTIEDAAEKTDPDNVKEIKREAVRQKIRAAKLGDAVLLAVEAISHIKKHGLPSLGKTEEYLLYVNESVLPNRLAMQVKIADNYVNMKDLIAAGASDDEARARLHKYASSIALLTEKK